MSEEVQLVLQASALEKGQLRAILRFPDPFFDSLVRYSLLQSPYSSSVERGLSGV